MYQFHSFNYIHCPNANEQEIKREFEILNQTQILTPENQLTPQQIHQMVHSKSFWDGDTKWQIAKNVDNGNKKGNLCSNKLPFLFIYLPPLPYQ